MDEGDRVLISHFLEPCPAGVSSFTGKGDGGGLHSHPARLGMGGGKCVSSAAASSLPPETPPREQSRMGWVRGQLREGVCQVTARRPSRA